MENKPLTSKDYFLSLKILHIGVIFSQIFVCVIFMYWIHNVQHDATITRTTEIFLYVVLIAAAFGIVGSQKYFRYRLDKIDDQNSLKSKLKEYQALIVLRLTFINFPSYTAIVAYIVTGFYFFLIIIGILIVVLAFLRPTKENTFSDLRLDSIEMDKLNTPDEIID